MAEELSEFIGGSEVDVVESDIVCGGFDCKLTDVGKDMRVAGRGDDRATVGGGDLRLNACGVAGGGETWVDCGEKFTIGHVRLGDNGEVPFLVVDQRDVKLVLIAFDVRVGHAT